jgi:hypothetical protein
MKINLVVIQGKFVCNRKLILKNYENSLCVQISKQSRLQFFWYGNIVILTKRGYWALYLTKNVKISLKSLIIPLIQFLQKTFDFSKTVCKVCNIHASGTLNVSRSELFKIIKKFVIDEGSKQFYVKEFDNTSVTLITPDNCNRLNSCKYIQHKTLYGTIRFPGSASSYSIISRNFEGIKFWQEYLQSAFNSK